MFLDNNVYNLLFAESTPIFLNAEEEVEENGEELKDSANSQNELDSILDENMDDNGTNFWFDYGKFLDQETESVKKEEGDRVNVHCLPRLLKK